MTGYDDKTNELDPVRSEALEWIIRLTSGTGTTADAEALSRWCAQSPGHAAAFAEAARLRRALKLAGREFLAEQRAAASAAGSNVARFPIERRAIGPKTALGRRGFLGGGLAAAAAGVAYVVVQPPFGLWPSLAEFRADYRTATGQQRGLAFADGITVEMNTQTSIKVRAAQGIELIAGETEINMAQPAEPFTVAASNGQAEARQAKFNMRHDESGVCVTCIDGAVEVRQRGKSVMLQPKQQVTYGDHGMGDVVSVDPQVVTAWRHGLLILHDEALAQVIQDVNRYRPGRIILANRELEDRRVNGVFHLDRIDSVIDEVRQLGATVTTLPGGVVLLS
jgi:transmembrane sensor